MITGKSHCIARKYLSEPNDVSNSPLAGLGCRFFLASVSWWCLGYALNPGAGFFVSMLLYQFPLFIDYTKFNPQNKFRKTLRKVDMVLSAVILAIGVIGVAGTLDIQLVNKELMISVSKKFIAFNDIQLPLQSLWYTLVITPLITAIDWAANISVLEEYETSNI